MESSHYRVWKMLTTQNMQKMPSSHPTFAKKLKYVVAQYNVQCLAKIAPDLHRESTLDQSEDSD